MGFDWKRLADEDRERNERTSRTMGITWIALGVIGPLIGFLIDGSFRWSSAIIWIGLGLVMLVPALIVQRRRK